MSGPALRDRSRRTDLGRVGSWIVPASVPFVHHVELCASDFAASDRILTAALGALGLEALHRTADEAEWWRPQDGSVSFSLRRQPREGFVTRRAHIAFAASDRAGVERFHDAAVAAGARSKHAPRFWPEYRAYAAFVRDPDGNSIECLHKEV